MRETSYDVVLYGASGFVGKQTVRYFAERAGAGVRWAIAGRDRSKLESVRAEVGIAVDILVADSQDKTAIDAIVSQTRVLLNTAGPFALYGDAIVDACVRYRTHYVDITGETPWVKGLIDRYHLQAATDGTRIIPCCGFDSVPSDLGAYWLVRYLQRELGTDCTQINAYYQAAGGFNGGTLASGLNIFDSGELEQVGNPFLLNPPESVPADLDGHRDPTAPQYDDEMETWVAPFFMGVVNTRIVRRSSALFDPSTREYLAVPAINQNYTQNLSLAQHRIIQRYVTNESQKVDIVALALAKQAIQDIVAEALKETKAAKTSKQIIKFLGTGRGKNVIRSQEESLEIAEKSALVDDIISEIEPLISNSINSGISDFSSAFGTTKEGNRSSTKENSAQLEEGKGVKAKKSKINTQPKSLPPIGEKTSPQKSKSKPKADDKKSLDKSADRESTLILEEQAPDLSAKSSLLENDLSSLDSSTPEVEKQESKTKSQASVGLPQWKPRQR